MLDYMFLKKGDRHLFLKKEVFFMKEYSYVASLGWINQTLT